MTDILQKLRTAVRLKREADNALYALAESLNGPSSNAAMDSVKAEEWRVINDFVSDLNDAADDPDDIEQEHADELKADWSAVHVPQ